MNDHFEKDQIFKKLIKKEIAMIFDFCLKDLFILILLIFNIHLPLFQLFLFALTFIYFLIFILIPIQCSVIFCQFIHLFCNQLFYMDLLCNLLIYLSFYFICCHFISFILIFCRQFLLGRFQFLILNYYPFRCFLKYLILDFMVFLKTLSFCQIQT